MPNKPGGTFFVKGEKIVLKKDGTWFADGIEITHEPTRDLFFKVIHWDENEKRYALSVGYETIFIEVEDTPYFVTALETKKGGTKAALSNFTSMMIRADRLSYENGGLYLKTDDGQRAKFLSAPYYELLKELQEDATHYFLAIAGTRVNLAPKGSPNPPARRGGSKRS